LLAPGTWTRIGAPDAAALTTAEKAAKETGEWIGLLTQHDAKGEAFLVESRWTLIRDDDGKPNSILLINTDVTEKQRLEEQMQKVQRMETIGGLAGGMAHDLNNALAPVLMGIQLLRERTAGVDDRRMLDLMEKNAERGTSMVRQVLMFSKGQTGERQPLSLTPLVDEIEETVRQTFPPGIKIHVSHPSDLWPILGNKTQMFQVLLNLCVNARDAMPQGGEINIDLDNAEFEAQELADVPELAPGRYVLLLVSDSGTGMPPEVRKRIFEPFFTTKGPEKGTGLGLSTCLRIIQQHGGGLRVTSALGEGTLFEILLPAAATLEVSPTSPTVAHETQGGNELILVADHEQALRGTIAASLTRHGFRAETAGTGLEALTRLRQTSDPVDLVLTGWNLPDVPGEQFLALVKGIRKNLPVLVMSNDAPPDPASTPEHPVAVLPKPVSTETMLKRIQHLLQRVRIGSKEKPRHPGNGTL